MTLHEVMDLMVWLVFSGGFLALAAWFARAATRATTAGQTALRWLACVVAVSWALNYGYRSLAGHPPVWASRVSTGLMLGMFGYWAWLMRVEDHVR